MEAVNQDTENVAILSPVWEEIGRVIGRTERQANHLLQRGQIKSARKGRRQVVRFRPGAQRRIRNFNSVSAMNGAGLAAAETVSEIRETPSAGKPEVSKPKSWRKVLPVHPAAELFPLMSEAELRELGEDIKKNGLNSPIHLWTPGDFAEKDSPVYLLDGRNRLDAMELVGHQPHVWLQESIRRFNRRFSTSELRTTFHYGSNRNRNSPGGVTDPYDYVISANIQRRHLTAEQRRELIASVLKAKPEQSNRQIAKQVKADDKTVAKVRTELEATAEIPQLKATVGKDGKARPAKRPEIDIREYADSCVAREIMAEQKVFDSPQEAHATKSNVIELGALSVAWREVEAHAAAGNSIA
jgi:hypothetical protein